MLGAYYTGGRCSPKPYTRCYLDHWAAIQFYHLDFVTERTGNWFRSEIFPILARFVWTKSDSVQFLDYIWQPSLMSCLQLIWWNNNLRITMGFIPYWSCYKIFCCCICFFEKAIANNSEKISAMFLDPQQNICQIMAGSTTMVSFGNSVNSWILLSRQRQNGPCECHNAVPPDVYLKTRLEGKCDKKVSQELLFSGLCWFNSFPTNGTYSSQEFVLKY